MRVTLIITMIKMVSFSLIDAMHIYSIIIISCLYIFYFCTIAASLYELIEFSFVSQTIKGGSKRS